MPEDVLLLVTIAQMIHSFALAPLKVALALGLFMQQHWERLKNAPLKGLCHHPLMVKRSLTAAPYISITIHRCLYLFPQLIKITVNKHKSPPEGAGAFLPL